MAHESRLVCEMRCEAVSNVDHREIERSYEMNHHFYDRALKLLRQKTFPR